MDVIFGNVNLPTPLPEESNMFLPKELFPQKKINPSSDSTIMHFKNKEVDSMDIDNDSMDVDFIEGRGDDGFDNLQHEEQLCSYSKTQQSFHQYQSKLKSRLQDF